MLSGFVLLTFFFFLVGKLVARRLDYTKRILSLLQTKARSYDKTITTYEKRNDDCFKLLYCCKHFFYSIHNFFHAIVSVIAAKVSDD